MRVKQTHIISFAFGFFVPFLLFPVLKPKKLVNHSLYSKFCDISDPQYSGSSRRDVILFSADSFHPGLELAVKTLRSAGSLCRVVILSSKPLKIPSKARKVFEQLDIEVRDNCSNNNRTREYVPHMLRFELEYQWLVENKNDVSRVFHSDAFDVMFQKDPFGPEITEDKVLFVLEPHVFRSCGWNLAWMKQCYGEKVMGSLMNNFIICKLK